MFNSMQFGLLFLIQVVFDLYILILILRVLLQLHRVNFYNPISQVVVKATQFVVGPVSKFIPSPRNINLAAIAVLFVVELIKGAVIITLQYGAIANPLGLIVWAIGDAANQLLTLYFYAVLLQVIMSWVAQGQYSPAMEILHRITAPLIHPVQRILPPLGGIDLSPIPVMILLKFLEYMVTYPIMTLGLAISLH